MQRVARRGPQGLEAADDLAKLAKLAKLAQPLADEAKCAVMRFNAAAPTRAR